MILQCGIVMQNHSFGITPKLQAEFSRGDDECSKAGGADLRSDLGCLQGRYPPRAHWLAALEMCLCCAAAIVHLLGNLSKNSNALVCLACVRTIAVGGHVHGPSWPVLAASETGWDTCCLTVIAMTKLFSP